MDAITINGLSKQYNKKYAIENVSLQVAEGEIFGFIGPNGAGKSTTIKVLLNFIKPDAGHAAIFGRDCQQAAKEIKTFTGYVSSDVRFYSKMTTAELLAFTADFHQVKQPKKEIQELMELFQIDPNKSIAELSLGNKKKVGLASALIAQPRMLILDEPTNGLDPLIQKRLFEELLKRNKQGMTIFLSSHDLHEIQTYAHRTAFIREGQIITVKELSEEENFGKVVTLTNEGSLSLAGLENVQVLAQESHSLRFFYQGDMNQLAHFLTNPAIKEFTIEHPTLEQQFMLLYEGGSQK